MRANKIIFGTAFILSFTLSSGISFYSGFHNDRIYVEAKSKEARPAVYITPEKMIDIPDYDIITQTEQADNVETDSNSQLQIPQIYNVSFVEVPKITINSSTQETDEDIANEMEDDEKSETVIASIIKEEDSGNPADMGEARPVDSDDSGNEAEVEEIVPFNNTPYPEHLTMQSGTFQGPSGKETYYNLDMSGCIDIMRGMGYSEEEYPYWIRDDGVKMFGPYVMVAAELSSRPKGTILECSLGTAIVVDTGTFAYSNPTQLDIAVAW